MSRLIRYLSIGILPLISAADSLAGPTPILEILFSYRGSVCSAGELKVNGHFVGHFLVSATHPLVNQTSRVWNGRIRYQPKVAGTRQSSGIEINMTEGEALTLSMILLSREGLSLSPVREFNQLEALGGYIGVGTYLSSNKCALDSYAPGQIGEPRIADMSWFDTAGRVLPRIWGTGAQTDTDAFVFINRETERVEYRGASVSFTQTQPTPMPKDGACLPKVLAAGHKDRPQSAGFVQCANWRYMNLGKEDVVMYERRRDLTHVILWHSTETFTVLGIEANLTYSVPLHPGNGAEFIFDRLDGVQTVSVSGEKVTRIDHWR